MKLFGVMALAGALLAAGCGSDSTTAPATTTTPTSPTTDIFTSIVSPKGGVSHAFTATQAGTVSLTLTAAGPPPTLVMRLGLGVIVNPGGCSLTKVIDTAAGTAPQLTLAVDAGDYCAAIVDIGNAPQTGASFFISILHP